MSAQPLDDVRRARIMEEVKNWAARRYGEHMKALAVSNAEIVPDTSDDAAYVVRLDLSAMPDSPESVEVKITCDENGQLCLATGD